MSFMKKTFENRKSPHKKSILNSWFLSYVAVLSLVIALIIFSESMYLDFFMKNTISKKETQITDFSENMDLLTEECKLFAFRLASDKKFQELYSSDLNLMKNHLLIGEFTKSYEGTMSSIDEYYIYIRNTDTIINSLGYVSDSYNYYNLYFLNTDVEHGDWINEYLNCRLADYHVYREYESSRLKKEVTKFCYALPVKAINGIDATIVVTVNSDRYIRKLYELENNISTSVIIYGNSGVRYFETGDFSPNDNQLAKIKNSDGFIEDEINGKMVVMSGVDSVTTSWNYAYVIPSSIFWEEVLSIKRLSVLIVLLIAALGLAGVYLITRFNYKSMAVVIKKIEQKISDGKINTKNEYEIISHMVDVTSQLSDKVKKHEMQARNSEISSLMLGLTNEAVKLDYEKYRRMFASNYFVSIVFSTSAFDKLFESENMSDSDRLSSMNFIIRNIFVELMEPYGSIDPVDMDNVVFLFSPKEEHLSHACAIARREAEKTIEAVFEYFNLEVKCGVSNMHETAANISVTYIEALSAVNMLSEELSKGVSLYTDNGASQKSYYYSIEQEQRLISLLSKGEYEESLNQIEDIVNMNTNILGLKYLKQALFTDIAGTIMKVSLKIGYSIDGEKMLNSIATGGYTISAKVFMRYIDEICDFVNKKNSCHTDILVEKAQQIMEENFRNVDFNVAILADMLNISANYLSTIYKKKTNDNLLDKIRSLRIEEAKLLIKESSNTFEQIAKESGFGSTTTFNRVFKKITGMSPSEYRDMK